MKKEREVARRIYAAFMKHHGREPPSEEDLDRVGRDLGRTIRRRFAPVLPGPGQTVAVTLKGIKTAALLFDRVWCLPNMEDGPPKSIAVFGATELELLFATLSMFPDPRHGPGGVFEDFDNTPISNIGKMGLRAFAEALFATHRIATTSVYDSTEELETEYKPGRKDLILHTINGSKLIDESALSWPQIAEIRRDDEARRKLRRMHTWFDTAMVGKPTSVLADSIATKVDDYEWALKKHGISTVTGALSGLLDPAFIAAAGAVTGLAYLTSDFWAGVSGLSLTLGKVAVSVTKARLDLEDAKRGANSEVAFIQHIKSVAKSDRKKAG